MFASIIKIDCIFKINSTIEGRNDRILQCGFDWMFGSHDFYKFMIGIFFFIISKERWILILTMSFATVLQAKKEIYDVKQQRLCLAQDEYNHLNNALTTLGASRTSCEYILIFIYFL